MARSCSLPRFRLNIRKNILAREIVQHWNRLSQGTVEFPSVRGFEYWLENANPQRGDLLWCEQEFQPKQELGLQVSRGPFKAAFVRF